MLRGLLGALQWPSTQAAPYMQCGVSQLAGEISSATTSTIDKGNKLLRQAKANADVGLTYHRLGGDPRKVTFLGYSDAAFASRNDLSSQGGYLILLTKADVLSGQTGQYNMIDWRSWKLPRIARSSLAAESQAAGECADALLYVSTFWKLPLDAPSTATLPVAPAMIIDAKALYDLLVKDEVQASHGTDKRTAIETLVCQDKLKARHAAVRWVSSELQYADSMTKTDGSQLLADRLRTHLLKITSDDSFQAAKKKDFKTRCKNTEMFALKRPSRAMQALFAFSTLTTTLANSTSNDTSFTNLSIESEFLCVVFFTGPNCNFSAMVVLENDVPDAGG